jgi:hypothetical protein
MDRLIKLSAEAQCALVVLCSGMTKIEHLSELVAAVPNTEVLMIDVPVGYSHDHIPTQTSAKQFRQASAWRTSDLSLKRNMGLMIARLHGWRKVVFIDDDISLKRDDLARIGWALERHPIAGMACRYFPDNSAVCHARRLVGLPQGNFVSGAVLGVNCDDHPLPFFPDVYNEDWFSFSDAAARRDVPKVGYARQDIYDPFVSPFRAKREEFGDLLAEGLFSLFGDAEAGVNFSEVLKRATPIFWEEFQDARRVIIDTTYGQLKLPAYEGNEVARRAMESLDASRSQLAIITPDDCVAFIDAWRDDKEKWLKTCASLHSAGSTWEAMQTLGIGEWRITKYRRKHIHATDREGSLHTR